MNKVALALVCAATMYGAAFADESASTTVQSTTVDPAPVASTTSNTTTLQARHGGRKIRQTSTNTNTSTQIPVTTEHSSSSTTVSH